MGNDGGSIPKRRELVKEAAKNPNLTDIKEKQKEHLAHRWSQCPISHKALTKPIVADCSGDLYNKEAIIHFLLPEDVSPLDKTEADAFIQGRIKGLRDIVEVHFEVEKDDTLKTEKWLCPITSKELGPNIKAVFLVPCGHAFSKEAITATQDDTTCPTCATPYETRDVVPILPHTEADKTFVIERIAKLRELGLTHSLKKVAGSKKRKANGKTKADGGEQPQSQSQSPSKTTITATAVTVSAPSKLNPTKPSSGIRNTATASLTAKVLEEEESKKRRRLEMGENENLKSLYSKHNKDKNKVKDGDFMTRGFSIPASGAKHG